MLIYPIHQALFLLLFSTHIACRYHLSSLKTFEFLLAFLSACQLVELLSFFISRMVPCNLQRGTAQVLIPLMRSLMQSMVLRKMFAPLRYPFIFYFISTYLVVSVSNILKLFIIFLFSVGSESFLIWRFYCFHYMSLIASNYQHSTFSKSKLILILWLYILSSTVKSKLNLLEEMSLDFHRSKTCFSSGKFFIAFMMNLMTFFNILSMF